jgi:hypothetical protein
MRDLSVRAFAPQLLCAPKRSFIATPFDETRRKFLKIAIACGSYRIAPIAEMGDSAKPTLAAKATI